MTSLPLMIDDEPMGIILRAGQQVLRPARIWRIAGSWTRARTEIIRIAICR